MYAILRFGRKHKTMYAIKGFAKHMERLIDVPNANEAANEILIGDENIVQNVSAYLQGVRLRSNSILAREVLTTASPEFFRGLPNNSECFREEWKNINKEWLKNSFGDNCLYSVLHKDETTWHIHSLIVPKFYSDKKQSYILSNARYFDGIDKLRTWQDNYADYMQKSFKELQRGIKHSKMKHMDIKTWYSLINAPVNENDIKLLTAKAKNSELLEIKLKAMMKTLDAYKKYNTNALQEVEEKVNSNNKLNKDLKKTKEEKEVYKQVINLLAKHYNLNANTLRSYINTAENSSNNSNEKTR